MSAMHEDWRDSEWIWAKDDLLIYAASNLPLLASEQVVLGSNSLSVSNDTPNLEQILSSPKNRDLNKAIATARSHTQWFLF